MAAKKQNRKPQRTKSRKTASKKTMPAKKAKNKTTHSPMAKKSLSKKKAVKKRALVKAKSKGRKVMDAKTARQVQKRIPPKRETVNTVSFPHEGRRAQSGQQSGDLQDLSSAERADSESVEELLEEGNAFEADVVKGVETAGDADEQEAHTHEVPEDDVPREYLDEE
jgi:hypothetical protein